MKRCEVCPFGMSSSLNPVEKPHKNLYVTLYMDIAIYMAFLHIDFYGVYHMKFYGALHMNPYGLFTYEVIW